MYHLNVVTIFTRLPDMLFLRVSNPAAVYRLKDRYCQARKETVTIPSKGISMEGYERVPDQLAEPMTNAQERFGHKLSAVLAAHRDTSKSI